MSTFHTKLRAFAECKRAAQAEARVREYFRASPTLQRAARHVRAERRRHKRIATRFGVRFAHEERYTCVHITREALHHHRLTQARRKRYPSVNYGRISAVSSAMRKYSPFEIASGATDRPIETEKYSRHVWKDITT